MRPREVWARWDEPEMQKCGKADPGWDESSEDKAKLAEVSNPDKAPSPNCAQCLLQT